MQILKSKIAFVGGGTGGHIYPIIAVYEKLKKHSNLQFIYFGSQNKLEEKISQENNIPFVVLPFIGGMPRSLELIIWLFKFAFASVIAIFKLSKYKPNIIFATGGYSSGPVLLAALILRIPYIIHNLDAHLGLANAAFIAQSLALTLGFPLTKPVLIKNGPVVLTGNPVREAFWQIQNTSNNLNLDSKRKTLLIMGGSQGALALNEIILELAPKLLEENWQIIHQVGEKQFSQFEKYFPQNPHYKPFKYLNNLWQIYAQTDIAISRAGAMSIAELTASKVPTIFIPLPTAAQNHQWHNAKQIEKAGACLLLEQKNLNPENLDKSINLAWENRDILKLKLSELPQQQNASHKIAQIIEQFLII